MPHFDRDAVERLLRAPLGPPPRGSYVGRLLGFLDTPGARRLDVRVFDTALFVWPRWGIDFDQQRWWFVDPRARVGHFRVVTGRSRWRDGEVLQLHCDVSRLPIRGLLYDEVKPIDEDTIVGVGGTNHDRGRGDHFLFSLERLVSR